MKNLKLTSMGIGLFVGLILGGIGVWSMTRNFVDDAVIQAENRFNQLLEEEKKKVTQQVQDIKNLEMNLDKVVYDYNHNLDSLNTAIENRNKQLNRIRKKYNEELSNINSMSHNQLTDYFSDRYGN